MTRLSLWVLLATLLPRPAHAQCVLPRVLLTVDRSSSMLGEAGGMTKWDAATVAISDVTMAYEDRIAFGLQVFPFPDRCEPGEVVLAPGAHDAFEIVDALGAPPPASGSWTPMAETLDAAGAYFGDAASGVHLVLVTDGWQWCAPYAPSTRFDPVRSVMSLRARGMTVHVVGFGSAVDALTLDRAALVGGAAIDGCDGSAPAHCYAQVADLATLRAALEAIARDVTAETCNAIDDDCDGVIDEGFDADMDGVAACAGDCDDLDEHVHPGARETCNGLDDDCDGAVDPDCHCPEGATMACGSRVGACREGAMTCRDGAYGACEGGVTPSAERCDGIDDDCDAAIDEDARCGEGTVCFGGVCTEIVPLARPGLDPAPATDEGVSPPQRGGCACCVGHRREGAIAWILLAVLGHLLRRRGAA